MPIPLLRLSAAVVLVACAIACTPEAEERAADTTQSMLYPGRDTAQPAPPLTDGNILALLDRASLTDSAAAAIAVQKATSSDLRGFARLMIRDHHLLRVEGERVARRLRIVPELPQGDESVAEMETILAMLNGAQRGRDFDKAYVDHEVAYHLDVLETATAAMQIARETEVRAYIQKLAPMLRDHLDRAQELQGRLR